MHWRIKQALDWGKARASDAALSLITRRLALPAPLRGRRVLLLGASVGQAWRLHLVFDGVRALAHYEFDKRPLLDRALAERPDAVILKECAAYFPDGGADRELVRGWLTELRRAAIRPVLATVVPVTREHAARVPGRAEAIWAFNDWLRALGGAEGLALLDLEAALRVSPTDRHLDDALDSGDGLHLAWQTYRDRLDPLVIPALLRAFGQPGR